MSNPGLYDPTSPESQFPPETPGHFRFGEVIAVPQGMRGEEDDFPPAKFIVVGHNYAQDSSPDTILAYAYLDSHEKPEIGPMSTQWLRFNKKFLEPPYATGESLSLKRLISAEMENELPGDNTDLRTYPWSPSTAQSLMTLVEQNIADKVTRGETVTESELAINQVRRERLADPEGTERLGDALDSGTIDLSPYIEAVEASQ